MKRKSAVTMLTWEEFERLPDRPGKEELLNGELLELPHAKYHHNKASARMYDRLRDTLAEAHARGEALCLGEVHIEMGYRLGGGKSWLQPDVSITHAGQVIADYIEGAPAIAIEVISPSNTRRALAKKRGLYFDFGARELWHVYRDDDPRIEVFVCGAADPAVFRETLTTPLLPSFSLDLADLLRA